MLNDKDFDEIGKRLYDLDADPPAQGWNKIKKAISDSDDPDKAGFFQSHWPKSFVLIFPLVIYLLWPINQYFLTTDNNQTQLIDFNKEQYQGLISTTETIVEKSEKVTIKPSQKTEITSRNKNFLKKGNLSLINSNTIATFLIEEEVKQPLNEKINISTENDREDFYLKEKLLNNSLTSVPENILDSTNNEPIKIVFEEKVQENILDDPKEEKEEKINSWRLSFSFSPQYIFKSLIPVQNDEVLITGLNNTNANYPERIGYYITVGAGKFVSKSFLVEGHLTFYRVGDHLSYNYATGALDTLIKTYHNGYIDVTPVYKITTREISNRTNFGGLKLDATWFFLDNGSRKFNITGSAGVNHLLMINQKEKINGIWTEIDDDSIEKTNYNFIVGAGYNLKMKKGIEFMVMPHLNYYLKSYSIQQPFILRQHAYGIQVSLFKNI